jgi:GNAT superfamily N-acetyltransferase
MEPEENIRQATVEDLDDLARLFDEYRTFYRQPSDIEGARRFLLARFENNQSVIFIATRNGSATGFVQLYPSFSSAAMARIFVLNDLFVAKEARRHGTGTALLQKAAEYGKAVGALRLSLRTELTNATAQRLYQSIGWKRDEVFCGYELNLR